MMGFAVVVGELIASSGAVFLQSALLGFMTSFLLTGSSMVVNDYYDREIDAINEPERPIPSGAVSPAEAIVYAVCLTSAGLATAYATSLECLIVALTSSALSALYNTRGKRTGLPGNFMVSACVATPFIYGGFSAGNGFEPLLWMFSLTAFISNTGREIVKGIVDVEGDRKKGINTVAVTLGSRRAAYLSAAFYLSAAIVGLIPVWFRSVSPLYIPLVAISDLGFTSSSISIIKRHSREDARSVKGKTLIWMLLGLSAFVAGAIGGGWR